MTITISDAGETVSLTSSTSITANYPGATVAGDRVFLVVRSWFDGGTFSFAASGFTSIASVDIPISGADSRLQVFTKIAASETDATVTRTANGFPPGVLQGWAVHVFTANGVASYDPSAATDTQADGFTSFQPADLSFTAADIVAVSIVSQPGVDDFGGSGPDGVSISEQYRFETATTSPFTPFNYTVSSTWPTGCITFGLSEIPVALPPSGGWTWGHLPFGARTSGF